MANKQSERWGTHRGPWLHRESERRGTHRGPWLRRESSSLYSSAQGQRVTSLEECKPWIPKESSLLIQSIGVKVDNGTFLPPLKICAINKKYDLRQHCHTGRKRWEVHGSLKIRHNDKVKADEIEMKKSAW